MKKLLKLLALGLLLLVFCGCDSKETGVTIQEEDRLAVKRNSNEYNIAVDYCNRNDILLDAYDNHSDAVVAFENHKDSMLLINEFDDSLISSEVRENTTPQILEGTSQFCAYFNKNNAELYNEFKTEIAEMKKDGTMDKLINKFKEEGSFAVSQNKCNRTIKVICAPIFEDRFYKDSKGKLSGVDYIILETAAARLNYNVEYINLEFETMFTNLEKGRGDLIFSATEYTPERAERFLTVNYLDVHYYLYKN